MVTFCIVNYNTDEILDINLKRLAGYPVIVAENSPFKYKDRHQVNYIAGVDKARAVFTPGNIKGKTPGKFDSGMHHSLAMEACLELVQTPYCCILDADFLINDVEYLLNIIKEKQLDVFGAPHGYKSHHSDIQNFNQPAIDNYPGSFCCFVRAELKPTLDYNKASNAYMNRHDGLQAPRSLNFIDTFYSFRQRMYKYRCESFKVCISNKCSICKKYRSLERLGRPLEKFYYTDRVVGLHFHYRSNEKITQDIIFYDEYHPNNNYLETP